MRAFKNILSRAIAGTATALAIAGCQTNATVAPGASFAIGAPTLTAGTFDANGNEVPVRGQSDDSGATYFTQSLPDEATLLKQITKVAGTAGSMSTALTTETGPVVTNVVPNKTGFLIEGTGLAKGGLQFILGSTTLQVVSAQNELVQVALPKGSATSGVLVVRDGTKEVVRTSADANNVYVLGRVMVNFNPSASRALIEQSLLNAGMLYYRYPGMNYVVAYYPMSLTFDQARTKLMAQGGIVDVTRDTLYVGKDLTVNDPSFKDQWALPMINAPRGWMYSTGSPDTIVAVLDSGVELTHAELVPNLFKNLKEIPGNGKDDDGNGRIDDYDGWNSVSQTGKVADDNGHGTNVAGIIGAAANNGQGIAGVAFNTAIMPVKVMNSQGLATTSSIVDGINYAVRNRASVINLSIASLIDDAPMKAAVQFANSFNVTVVAAMGNDGAQIKEYPAAYSADTGLIAVGATNNRDVRPTWGTTGSWMTVSAPGEGILTTARGGTYATVSGSSFAAAYASGMAATIKAAKPIYTPAMIRDLMVKTAVDRGTTGFDTEYGNGRINFDDSLQSVIGIANLKASSEHFIGTFPASAAGDKNPETYWSSARRVQDNPEWLKMDIGRVVSLTSVAFLSAPFYSFLFPSDFTIETSADGVIWKAVAAEVNFQISESTWHRWNIPATQARYVRLNITKSRTNPDNGLYYDQVAEVAFNGEENSVIRNSSSNYYGIFYPTSFMTDKNPDTYWVSANRKKPTPEFAIADLGVSKSITSFDLLSPPKIISEAFPKAVAFYVSNDKVNWTYVNEFKGLKATPSTWYHFPVSLTSGRYVRIDVTQTNFAKSNGALYAGYQLEGFTAAIAEVDVNRP